MISRMEAARVVPCPECKVRAGAVCIGILHKGTVPCEVDEDLYGDRCIAHHSPAQCRKARAVGLPLAAGHSHNGRLFDFWQWQKRGQAELRQRQLVAWLRDHGHILTDASC